MPNVLAVEFENNIDIWIPKNSFAGFTQLRSVMFTHSTIAQIERNALAALPTLKVFAIDRYLRQPLSAVERDQLWLFHCSIEYAWLRAYFFEHSELLQPRGSGEIFYFPSIKGATGAVEPISSAELSGRDIYYPVDCSKDDLRGFEGQEDFSINAP